VDDLAERLPYSPHLLHAERPDLRVLAVQTELVDRCGGQIALRALGEHRQVGDDVVSRLECRQLLPVATAPTVSRARSDHPAVLHEELRRRGLGQDDRPDRLGLLREEATELGHREDEVAVVPHRRRRGDPQRRAARQHVHGLPRHLAVGREVGRLQPSLEELTQW
jgi:hypothetical protein